MKKRIVVALGGNALGLKIEDQKKAVALASEHVSNLIEKGHDVVIVHGNGPQVGLVQLAFSTASKYDKNVEPMPLVESIAMTQGYIGYHLQNSLVNQLSQIGVKKPVVTLSTQIEVDANDPSFQTPSKPIGPFYTEEEISNLNLNHFIEDSGRGYREVVASPQPVNIIEIDAIKSALDLGQVVICCGGGGIPVISNNGKLEAIDAVIDKDAAAALLATQLEAELLLILTEVDQVSLNFGKDNEQHLNLVNTEILNVYISEGHFAPGSMLPKIKAAKLFTERSNNGSAIITSLHFAEKSLSKQAGTHITK